MTFALILGNNAEKQVKDFMALVINSLIKILR